MEGGAGEGARGPAAKPSSASTATVADDGTAPQKNGAHTTAGYGTQTSNHNKESDTKYTAATSLGPTKAELAVVGSGKAASVGSKRAASKASTPATRTPFSLRAQMKMIMAEEEKEKMEAARIAQETEAREAQEKEVAAAAAAVEAAEAEAEAEEEEAAGPEEASDSGVPDAVTQHGGKAKVFTKSRSGGVGAKARRSKGGGAQALKCKARVDVPAELGKGDDEGSDAATPKATGKAGRRWAYSSSSSDTPKPSPKSKAKPVKEKFGRTTVEGLEAAAGAGVGGSESSGSAVKGIGGSSSAKPKGRAKNSGRKAGEATATEKKKSSSATKGTVGRAKAVGSKSRVTSVTSAAETATSIAANQKGNKKGRSKNPRKRGGTAAAAAEDSGVADVEERVDEERESSPGAAADADADGVDANATGGDDSDHPQAVVLTKRRHGRRAANKGKASTATEAAVTVAGSAAADKTTAGSKSTPKATAARKGKKGKSRAIAQCDFSKADTASTAAPAEKDDEEEAQESKDPKEGGVLNPSSLDDQIYGAACDEKTTSTAAGHKRRGTRGAATIGGKVSDSNESTDKVGPDTAAPGGGTGKTKADKSKEDRFEQTNTSRSGGVDGIRNLGVRRKRGGKAPEALTITQGGEDGAGGREQEGDSAEREVGVSEHERETVTTVRAAPKGKKRKGQQDKQEKRKEAWSEPSQAPATVPAADTDVDVGKKDVGRDKEVAPVPAARRSKASSGEEQAGSKRGDTAEEGVANDSNGPRLSSAAAKEKGEKKGKHQASEENEEMTGLESSPEGPSPSLARKRSKNGKRRLALARDVASSDDGDEPRRSSAAAQTKNRRKEEKHRERVEDEMTGLEISPERQSSSLARKDSKNRKRRLALERDSADSNDSRERSSAVAGKKKQKGGKKKAEDSARDGRRKEEKGMIPRKSSATGRDGKVIKRQSYVSTERARGRSRSRSRSRSGRRRACRSGSRSRSCSRSYSRRQSRSSNRSTSTSRSHKYNRGRDRDHRRSHTGSHSSSRSLSHSISSSSRSRSISTSTSDSDSDSSRDWSGSDGSATATRKRSGRSRSASNKRGREVNRRHHRPTKKMSSSFQRRRDGGGSSSSDESDGDCRRKRKRRRSPRSRSGSRDGGRLHRRRCSSLGDAGGGSNGRGRGHYSDERRKTSPEGSRGHGWKSGKRGLSPSSGEEDGDDYRAIQDRRYRKHEDNGRSGGSPGRRDSARARKGDEGVKPVTLTKKSPDESFSIPRKKEAQSRSGRDHSNGVLPRRGRKSRRCDRKKSRSRSSSRSASRSNSHARDRDWSRKQRSTSRTRDSSSKRRGMDGQAQDSASNPGHDRRRESRGGGGSESSSRSSRSDDVRTRRMNRSRSRSPSRDRDGRRGSSGGIRGGVWDRGAEHEHQRSVRVGKDDARGALDGRGGSRAEGVSVARAVSEVAAAATARATKAEADAAVEAASRKRQDNLEARLLKKIKEKPALRTAKCVHSRITDSDPIDKMGTMLDPEKNSLSDFTVQDSRGRIIKEPSVAMLIEELHGEEQPLSWWGVVTYPDLPPTGLPPPPPPLPPPPISSPRHPPTQRNLHAPNHHQQVQYPGISAVAWSTSSWQGDTSMVSAPPPVNGVGAGGTYGGVGVNQRVAVNNYSFDPYVNRPQHHYHHQHHDHQHHHQQLQPQPQPPLPPPPSHEMFPAPPPPNPSRAPSSIPPLHPPPPSAGFAGGYVGSGAARGGASNPPLGA